MALSFAASLLFAAAGASSVAGTRAELLEGGIANSDYPVEALAAKQEGVVTTRFNVDKRGKTSRCSVLESSGFQQLDTRTCGIIEARFRYRPALNSNGKPIDEWRTQRIAWRLPDLNAMVSPPATEPVRAEFLLEIGTDGMVESCRVRTSSGDPKWDSEQCRAVGQSTKFQPKVGPDGRKENYIHLWRVR